MTAKKDASKVTDVVRIVARKAGFRRCGMAHAAEPVEHEPGTFSAAQLETLQAEPNLIVDVFPPKKESGAKTPPAS